jgi:hypothetical protein
MDVLFFLFFLWYGLSSCVGLGTKRTKWQRQVKVSQKSNNVWIYAQNTVYCTEYTGWI